MLQVPSRQRDRHQFPWQLLSPADSQGFSPRAVLIFYSLSLKAPTHPRDPAGRAWALLNHIEGKQLRVSHTRTQRLPGLRAAARVWLFIRNDTGKTECLPSDPGKGHTDGFQARQSFRTRDNSPAHELCCFLLCNYKIFAAGSQRSCGSNHESRAESFAKRGQGWNFLLVRIWSRRDLSCGFTSGAADAPGPRRMLRGQSRELFPAGIARLLLLPRLGWC